eukprot:Phypoly_transcript_04294.p1 GENE.Phypoly_transcript_04294~~Phypoly_transcript_04294.p1  ORF type:complete len:546 (+),score=93.93 Phypoly_transcript_04294:324-1961(+)
MAEFIQNSAFNGEPKGPPQACLFVANLPSPEVGEDRIREHFSQFGEVLKVKLIKDRSSRPYAFVQFCEVDDSNEALKSNKLFDGKRLRVERAKVNRTLFIAKLSRNTTNIALREQAQKFGPVESVTIIKNHQTNRSKGCGFVKYTYREDAMDAFVGLKNVNHKWVIEWATSTNDPDTLGVDKFNVFLGGLNPDEVTKESIEARFSEYGEIETVSLVNKDDEIDEAASLGPASLGPHSAFAFVRFADPAASAAAIEAENGAEWLGRRIRVQYCESAEMKNKRRITKYTQQPYSPAHIPSVPFYGSHAPGQLMEPRPMMMMGGLPMYNIPPTSNLKGSYGARSKGDPIYTPAMGTGYINPTLLAYTQPWLYPQLQQPIPQQHPLHLLPPTGRPIHPLPSHMQHVPQHMQHFQPHQVMSPHSTHHSTHPSHSSSHPSHLSPSPNPSHSSPHHISPRSQHTNHPNHNPSHSSHSSPHANHPSPHSTHASPHPSHSTHPSQTQSHHLQASHTPGRSLPSLQRNREGAVSPYSDDSIDGGLTQSIAGWVLK